MRPCSPAPRARPAAPARARPAAAASARPRLCAAATTGFHTLPDGARLELLSLPADPAAAGAADAARPPLLFLHGSYHGAWCWAERWMPLFAAAGWDASAVSLRAQGGSDRGAPPLKVSGTLASHADDLAAVVGAMGAPPVLIAHSFGALLAAKYLSRLGGAAPPPPLAGAALLAGVPPSGNGGVVGRIARRAPLAAARLTYGFIARSFARSADEARFMFFSDDLPAEDLGRYQALLAAGSPARLLDLGALKAELPVPLPPTDVLVNLPRFVGGGADDAIVDAEALAEAVAWLGLPPGTERIWPRTAHDCMLDTRWEAAARDVLGWLEAEVR